MLRGMVSVLIVITLSRVHVHMGLAQARPVLLLAIACVAFAIMNPRLVNAERILSFWPARVFVALAVIACLSAPFGISLGGTAVFILDVFSKCLILSFLIIAGVRHARDLLTFVWAYVLSCGFLAYLAIFVFRVRMTQGVARLNNLYTFDSNDISTILMAGLPLTLLVYQNSVGRKKVLAGAILVGIGATMARSGSRGGFLALLAVGAALLFWVPGVAAAKRIMFVGTVATALVIAAPAGYWEQMRTLLSPTEDYNWDEYYGRRKTAERGIEYMLRYPVFGVGIGQFARADGTISDRAVTFVDRVGYSVRWRAAHNSFVEAGAETGIPGLLLWTSLIVGGIGSMRRLRKRLPRGWLHGTPEQRFLYSMTIYLPVSFIGFAVAAFWVSFAWIEPVYFLAAFVVGVHISVTALLKQSPGSGPGRAAPRRGSLGRVPPAPTPLAGRGA